MIRTLSLMICFGACIGITSSDVFGQYLIKFPVVQSELLQADGGPDHQAGYGALVQLGAAVPATGGTPPYSYRWSPGTGLNDSAVSNPTLTLDTTRTYVFTVTDADSCTASVSILVEMLIGLENPDNRASLNVFPNPVHGRTVWIKRGGVVDKNYQCLLFSATGTHIWSGMAYGNLSLLNFEDSGLKAGVYTLCVVVDGERFFRKIIFL